MDLRIVLILTSALIAQVYSLMCNNCFSDATGTCHDVQGPCPDQCASVRIATYQDYRRKDVMTLKTCTPSDMCVTGSLNFGTSRVKAESTCCGTDLCNDEAPPESLTDISNGMRCYTCRNGDCTSIIRCLGDEDFCVTSTSAEGIQKGCASRSICRPRGSNHFLSSVADGLACCEGNLCNGMEGMGTNQNTGNSGHKSHTQSFLLIVLMSVASNSDMVS
ncbi:urokinase plasminogen activator surface receptor-like [Sardina pilchardus]|uniref:urokinase plasminogen activator surface receptor-like n=1 Tax=Sardina pilchardus TaxID=27697 RepID=UPI002E144668